MEDGSYLLMEVMIVKEVMKGDVSPVAMFLTNIMPAYISDIVFISIAKRCS